MLRKPVITIAISSALALLAGTMPASVSGAEKMTAKRDKLPMQMPAVQKIRHPAIRKSQGKNTGRPKGKVQPHVQVFDGRTE